MNLTELSLGTTITTIAYQALSVSQALIPETAHLIVTIPICIVQMGRRS